MTLSQILSMYIELKRYFLYLDDSTVHGTCIMVHIYCNDQAINASILHQEKPTMLVTLLSLRVVPANYLQENTNKRLNLTIQCLTSTKSRSLNWDDDLTTQNYCCLQNSWQTPRRVNHLSPLSL